LCHICFSMFTNWLIRSFNCLKYSTIETPFSNQRLVSFVFNTKCWPLLFLLKEAFDRFSHYCWINDVNNVRHYFMFNEQVNDCPKKILPSKLTWNSPSLNTMVLSTKGSIIFMNSSFYNNLETQNFEML